MACHDDCVRNHDDGMMSHDECLMIQVDVGDNESSSQ